MNLSATFNILRLVYSPSYCKPQCIISNFNQLPLPINDKVKAVVVDKDNCISFPHEKEVWPEYKNKWEELKNHYPGRAVLIVSNTAGSNDDPNYEQAKILEESTGVSVLRHKTKKPGCTNEILEYFYKNKIINSPDEVAVIGDRLFTDVMMANMMGSYSVWIREGVKLSNNPIIKFERRISDYFKFGK